MYQIRLPEMPMVSNQTWIFTNNIRNLNNDFWCCCPCTTTFELYNSSIYSLKTRSKIFKQAHLWYEFLLLRKQIFLSLHYTQLFPLLKIRVHDEYKWFVTPEWTDRNKIFSLLMQYQNGICIWCLYCLIGVALSTFQPTQNCGIACQTNKNNICRLKISHTVIFICIITRNIFFSQNISFKIIQVKFIMLDFCHRVRGEH